ncbi:sugar-phosphate isomerase RpiB/LacA/LacB family [Corallococcus sp. CAG:1435]|nr:sugar-phosphate isomerase RpiB/LacA/LacB family [Corallococcus sp. CAG:1435]
MKIAMASDHGGLDLKNRVKQYLEECGHQVVNFGTYTADSCDYPDFARPCAEAVANGSCERGIVVCTTGIGVSIVANKVKGVRCALCTNSDMATMTRRHNNANVLAMGQRYVDFDTAKQIVNAFLSTPFDGGRHQRRVDKIETL